MLLLTGSVSLETGCSFPSDAELGKERIELIGDTNLIAADN
jgi:hypothetical protein